MHPRYLLCLLLLLLAGCAGGDGAGSASGLDESVIRHNILGTAHLGQTQWAEAEGEFRRALEARPDDPLLLTNTAIAITQLERTDEATELLARAIAADAGYVSAHFNLGLIESRRGNFEAAAVHFERAVELDAQDLFTRYYLGTSLARIDRETEAIEALRAALERDPTHVSTLYALGRLLLQQGQQDEGMQLITRSQEIRARSGLDEAIGSEYGEQGPLSRAADYPGGELPAPAPIEVRFEIGDRVTGGPATVLPGGELRTVDDASIVALTAGDADNDGTVDLALLAASDGTLTPAWMREADGEPLAGAFGGEAQTALDGALAGSDLAFVDRDHDGDLDLFWCWTTESGAGGCKLATNDGEGGFEVAGSGAHGFEPGFEQAGPVTVAFSDIDNDRDVDLLVAGPGGVRLFTNQRDGSFDAIGDEAGLGSDGNLVLAGPQGVALRVNRHGAFEPTTPLIPGAAASGLVVFDFDNDGFLDVAAGTPSGPVLQHNRGAGAWDVSDALAIEGLSDAVVPLSSFDADGDGDLDLAVREEEALLLLVNQGGNANRWIELASTGIGDNKFGIGAKVELLAGALRQKFEVTRPLPIHAGLGGRDGVQAARYLWPSGVVQDEIELPAGGPAAVTQLDRKGTSCPLLYAWRDGGWRFVTDFLGGSAVGYQHAPGVFSIPDTDEYVRIDDGLTPDADGRLRLRMNNQLEEVLWFDQVELIAVDHPQGTEVYPNERLMPAPPFPEFALYGSGEVRPVAAARGVESDRDLGETLARRDERYVDDFALLGPKGYAETHTLELDLGAFANDERVVLLLDGWIDYADSSANVAARQAGLQLLPPRLLVADGEGGWRDVGDGLMGFPAGLPKTMTVPLTGLFPSDDHRLRIRTNMRIYWDRARVMVGGAGTPLSVARLRPVAAELSFGGFPRPERAGRRAPYRYDPGDVSPDHSWKAHVGQYTGFGDVRPLLDEIDDRFVTTRNGDQIELQFEAPPAPAAGFVRTYLLFADGFGKDMDPNSAANSEIGPVPFHGMPAYPYPADVVPPVAQHTDSPAPRSVTRAADGMPGALPLARHAGR
jgi:Flp pilus assembly protein TadD